MRIDLTPVFQAVIALLAALITYKLIPWIRSKTTETQQANLRALVKVLVFAAEQLYGAGNGAAKLDYVQEKLEEQGFSVDREEIEAAVNEYFGHFSCAPVTGYQAEQEEAGTEAETEPGNDDAAEETEAIPEEVAEDTPGVMEPVPPGGENETTAEEKPSVDVAFY